LYAGTCHCTKYSLRAELLDIQIMKIFSEFLLLALSLSFLMLLCLT
jgi:hypothetical protein